MSPFEAGFCIGSLITCVVIIIGLYVNERGWL